MIRLVLCEDDLLFQEEMHNRLLHIFEQLNVKLQIHRISDPTMVSDQILTGCDIAVLDIDLNHPQYNGMDIARKLRSLRKDSVIVFLTNYIEFAPEGYEVQAFRYILKSQAEQMLQPVMVQAIDQLKKHNETLKIQINGEIIDLLLENIRYLEVLQHNVTIHYDQPKAGKPNKTYSVHTSLSALEEQLAAKGFLRIHKSFLVNMRYIKKFRCNEIELYSGEMLRVSEKYAPVLKKKYLLWKGW